MPSRSYESVPLTSVCDYDDVHRIDIDNETSEQASNSRNRNSKVTRVENSYWSNENQSVTHSCTAVNIL